MMMMIEEEGIDHQEIGLGEMKKHMTDTETETRCGIEAVVATADAVEAATETGTETWSGVADHQDEADPGRGTETKPPL